MDGGAWWAAVYGAAKSRARLSDLTNYGFPGGSDGKESSCNAGDAGSIPGSGRVPREEILAWRILARGAWQATVHGVTKSQT